MENALWYTWYLVINTYPTSVHTALQPRRTSIRAQIQTIPVLFLFSSHRAISAHENRKKEKKKKKTTHASRRKRWPRKCFIPAFLTRPTTHHPQPKEHNTSRSFVPETWVSVVKGINRPSPASKSHSIRQLSSEFRAGETKNEEIHHRSYTSKITAFSRQESRRKKEAVIEFLRS